MRRLLTLLPFLFCTAALAQSRASHAKLLDTYVEPDTWVNRSNFYFGARGGVAIPSGAHNIAPSAGLEVGVASNFGVGFGLHVLWMDAPPGAPILGVGPAQYGFGALSDMRFYIPTIEPLTLYPAMSIGFVAGPDLGGRNMVLPLFNPGFGAKVKFGNFYGSFEFGFAGFTIPYVTLALGYEGDRRKERAEKWALEHEGVPLDPPAPPQLDPIP
jgi:hypothetical protein